MWFHHMHSIEFPRSLIWFPVNFYFSWKLVMIYLKILFNKKKSKEVKVDQFKYNGYILDISHDWEIIKEYLGSAYGKSESQSGIVDDMLLTII